MLARKAVTKDFQIFPERLSDLMKKRGLTQQNLADSMGVKRQTISLYKSGQSMPDAKTLRDLAEYFNVSSDYLLGLSDVQSADISIKEICEYTGLSVEAVEMLCSLKKLDFTDCSETLNRIFHYELNSDELGETYSSVLFLITLYFKYSGNTENRIIDTNDIIFTYNSTHNRPADAGGFKLNGRFVENAILEEIKQSLRRIKDIKKTAPGATDTRDG